VADLSINVAQLKRDWDKMTLAELIEKYGFSDPTLRKALTCGKRTYEVSERAVRAAKTRASNKSKRAKKSAKKSDDHKADNGVTKNYAADATLKAVRVWLKPAVAAQFRAFCKANAIEEEGQAELFGTILEATMKQYGNKALALAREVDEIDRKLGREYRAAMAEA